MTTIRDYQNVFNILPPETVYAGEFLESRGQRLGEEYGTSNAVSKAALLLLLEMEIDEGYGFGV